MRLGRTAVALVCALLAAGPAIAQTPPAQSLEDSAPEQLPYATPYGTPIAGDRAARMVDAALVEVAKHPAWQFSFAIVDTEGELVYFYRMPNAALSSIRNAQSKAITAVRYRRETGTFYEAIKAGEAFTPPADSTFTAATGGFPLIENGKIVGAIGCSGGTGGQDSAACRAAIAALK
jgi:glc operon protein GlcG